MSDHRKDDIFLSDIEKLKEKYSAYDLEEEEQSVSESVDPIIKEEPKQIKIEAPKSIDTSVFMDKTFDDRDVFSNTPDIPKPVANISVAPVKVDISVPIEEHIEEKPIEQPTKAENVFSDDAAPVVDEFDDLDDDNDIAVIGKGTSIFSPSAEKKEKEKKPKAKKEKASAKQKNPKKLLVIILAIAIPVVLWIGAFVTDLVLVNKWYTPFFCVETAEYENGSKNYVGLFYKIQFHVEEDGDVSGECIPWFVEGPNDKI